MRGNLKKSRLRNNTILVLFCFLICNVFFEVFYNKENEEKDKIEYNLYRNPDTVEIKYKKDTTEISISGEMKFKITSHRIGDEYYLDDEETLFMSRKDTVFAIPQEVMGLYIHKRTIKKINENYFRTDDLAFNYDENRTDTIYSIIYDSLFQVSKVLLRNYVQYRVISII